MFAAFSVRALDPPFATVSMDEQDSSPDPEAPGHHLKELLAKQAILSTGNVTNMNEICELYEISPLPESVAELVQALYEKEFTDTYGDCSDQPATAISAIEGDFAFMMYDSSSGYFLTARSASGHQPFFWGTSEEREDIVILSSAPSGLSDFPPGCLFESNGDATGDLENFTRHTPKRRLVNAMPKVNSHGHLCAVKYTTQSGNDLAALATQPAA